MGALLVKIKAAQLAMYTNLVERQGQENVDPNFTILQMIEAMPTISAGPVIPPEPERRYVRPAIYPAIPTLQSDEVLQLVRVTPEGVSWACFGAGLYTGSNMTIDWGDGTVTDYLNKTSISVNHVYDFTTLTAPIATDGNKYVWAKLFAKDGASHIKTIYWASIPNTVVSQAVSSITEIYINAGECSGIDDGSSSGATYIKGVESFVVQDTLITEVENSLNGFPFLENIVWNELLKYTGSFISLNSLLELHTPNATWAENSVNSNYNQTVIYAPLLNYINGSFIGLRNMRALKFDLCVNMEGGACSNCPNVTEISFKGLKTTAGGCFANLISLEEAELLELIYGAVFAGCVNLKYVNIPNMEYVEPNGFSNVPSLMVVLAGKVRELRGNNFTVLSSALILDLPELVSVLSGCITGASRLKIFNNAVTSWGNNNMQGLYSIETLDISKTITMGTGNVIQANICTELRTGDLEVVGAGNFVGMQMLRKPEMPKLRSAVHSFFSSANITDYSGLPIQNVAIARLEIYNHPYTKKLPTAVNDATTQLWLNLNGASRADYVAMWTGFASRVGKPALQIYVSYEHQFTAPELQKATDKNIVINLY